MTMRGSVLVEVLIAAALALVLLAVSSADLIVTDRFTRDQMIELETAEEARELLHKISGMLGALGSGTAFSLLSEFPETPDTESLLPIEPGADESGISFWFDETGEVGLLVEDFSPTPSQRKISITGLSSLQLGSQVVLLGLKPGANSILRGEISSSNTGIFELERNYVSTPSAQFLKGSLVRQIKHGRILQLTPHQVAIQSGEDLSETHVIARNTSVTFSYLNSESQVIATPLTASSIRNELVAVKVELAHTSQKKLTTGENVEALFQQLVILENLRRPL